ncbi:MAG: hypothetical protein WAN04_09675 [Candidatus Udaeobacter sp.]
MSINDVLSHRLRHLTRIEQIGNLRDGRQKSHIEHFVPWAAEWGRVGSGMGSRLQGVLPKSDLTGKKKVPKLGEMC